jgi:hypothetical protein
MNPSPTSITALFNRIPRRHSLENVAEIKNIADEYEDLLKEIEGINVFYEKCTSSFFDELEEVRLKIKKSTDNKLSKKGKDDVFDDASSLLKDSMLGLMEVYGDGNKEA